MTFELKHKPRSRVHILTHEMLTKEVSCQFCGGTGRVTGRDKTQGRCPECGGHKSFKETIGVQWSILRTAIVQKVLVIWNAGEAPKEKVFFGQYGESAEAEDAFAKLADAQAECDRRNAAQAAEGEVRDDG